MSGARIAPFARPVADSEGETLAPEAESPAPGPEKLAELAQAKGCIEGCLRKLGKLEEAAAMYREVADVREDDFLTECALWHLSALGWRREVEKQLAEIRKARPNR